MKFQIDHKITARILNPDDADTLFELVDRNRGYLRQWLPWLDYNTKPEHSRLFIHGIQKQLSDGKGFACGVFFDEKLAGICGYHEIDDTTRSVVIGYWLSEEYQGNGIVTRCTRFFTDYAFKELKLEKVFIPVAEGNAKSRAVCERLGFVSEGLKPDAENLYGTWVNHVCYAMSADDWPTALK